MRTLQRAAAALIYPAILCLGVSCERANPPTSSPPGSGPRAELSAPTDVPDWVGKLLLLNTPLDADPAMTQPELPGLGTKFQLLYSMVDDQDPQNLTNDVISVNATPTTIGVAVRNLPPGIKIDALTDQMHVRYFFPVRTCLYGSPRIQLKIDGDGDGKWVQFLGGPDQNAFGYVGHTAFGGGCITGDWDVIDMTDNIGRWDLSQFGGAMTFTWDQAVLFMEVDRKARCSSAERHSLVPAAG